MPTKRKGGRPKKKAGSRVADQLHFGFRFDDDSAAKLRSVVDRKNAELLKAGLPPVTAYAMIQHWIHERLSAEYEKP